jgi:hypothetical protein
MIRNQTNLSAVWRRSSRSSSGGNVNCVEVGAWRKSTLSGSGHGANCVEAGTCGCQAIAIRDSKVPVGPLLTTERGEWVSLLSAVKHGDFDR